MNQTKKANVLIVDDVTANLAILAEIIKQRGYIARPVTSVKQARQAMKELEPQLILLDVSMPEIGGFEFCEELKANPHTREIPVIFISAMTSPEDKKKGFQLGAVDFIAKPFDVDEVILRVNTHLKNYTMQQELEAYNKRLHKMMEDQIRRISEEQKHLILAVAKLYEEENATSSFLDDVAFNARLLAQSLQFSPQYEKEISGSFIEDIELAVPLYNIGKVAIRNQTLFRKADLAPDELEVMKTHAEIGARALMEVYSHNEYSQYLKMAIDIAYYHHECWDGTGYPRGLAGKEIPLSARIAVTAISYNSLRQELYFREAMSHKEAMEYINAKSGKRYDPGIVDILNKIQNQLRHTDWGGKDE